MEVLLARAEAVGPAAEVVRRLVEPGAEVTPSPAEGAVRFQTAKAEDELAGLLAALVTAGLGVTQFREVQTDLEAAFMTVSQQADREGTPAA